MIEKNIKGLPRKNRGGFTLIELLIAIAIVSIISSIGFGTFNSTQSRGRDTKRKSDLNNIKIALEAYHADRGVYPPTSDPNCLPNHDGCTMRSDNTNTPWIPDLSAEYMKGLPKDPKQAAIPSFLALRDFFNKIFGQPEKVYAAPPTFGAVSSASTNTASSLTWSHPVSGTNRILIVGVSLSAAYAVSSITYGGVPLSLIGNAVSGTSTPGAHERIELWYLTEAQGLPTGTNSVIVSFNGSTRAVAGATSWTGVNQTTPLGTFASATSGSLGSTTPSVNVNTTADDMVVDVLAAGPLSATATVGANQTQRWNLLVSDLTLNRTRGAASSETAISSTTTMSWTLSVATRWVIGAVPLKSAPTPTPTPTATPTPMPALPCVAGSVFNDDFSSGMGQWTVESGNWLVESGELSQDNTSERQKIRITQSFNQSAITVCANMKFLQPNVVSGIMIRQGTGSSGYHAVRLDERDNTAQIVINDGVAQSSPYTISQNTWYQLKAVIDGTNIKFYVNEALVLEYNDLPVGGNEIGLKTSLGHTHFDGVSVSIPATPTPTPTNTPTPTPTITPTPTPTNTPTPTATPIPPTPTPTPTPPPPPGEGASFTYLYAVYTNHQNFILWAQLENSGDPETWNKSKTRCKEDPANYKEGLNTVYNYCLTAL